MLPHYLFASVIQLLILDNTVCINICTRLYCASGLNKYVTCEVENAIKITSLDLVTSQRCNPGTYGDVKTGDVSFVWVDNNCQGNFDVCADYATTTTAVLEGQTSPLPLPTPTPPLPTPPPPPITTTTSSTPILITFKPTGLNETQMTTQRTQDNKQNETKMYMSTDHLPGSTMFTAISVLTPGSSGPALQVGTPAKSESDYLCTVIPSVIGSATIIAILSGFIYLKFGRNRCTKISPALN